MLDFSMVVHKLLGEVMVELHLAATIGQFILIRKKTLKTGCK